MISLYNLILYEPLLNILIFFYNTIALRDLGLAIIFLTILVRLILFPVFQKSARHQLIMQTLQPKIKKIQEENKNDRTKQTQAMMAIYKDHKINPFSGFFLILIQLPILIALYQIFLKEITPAVLSNLYSFIKIPSVINYSFLGLINLGISNKVLVGLAALAQYFQGKLSLPQVDKNRELSQAEKISRRMVFFGPILTFVIFLNLPAAVGLYWLVASVFSIGQQIIINKQIKKEIKDGELGNVHKKDNRNDGIPRFSG